MNWPRKILSTLGNFVDKFPALLKSDSNNCYFRWIPMYIYDKMSLKSSQNEQCFTQTLYRKSKCILCPIIFYFRKSCRLWDNVKKYFTAWQTTWHCGTCALHARYLRLQTHSQYAIFIALPLQQWLHERASILRYKHIACLVPLTCTLLQIFHQISTPSRLSLMNSWHLC